jgi:hypothetical protein
MILLLNLIVRLPWLLTTAEKTFQQKNETEKLGEPPRSARFLSSQFLLSN